MIAPLRLKFKHMYIHILCRSKTDFYWISTTFSQKQTTPLARRHQPVTQTHASETENLKSRGKDGRFCNVQGETTGSERGCGIVVATEWGTVELCCRDCIRDVAVLEWKLALFTRDDDERNLADDTLFGVSNSRQRWPANTKLVQIKS